MQKRTIRPDPVIPDHEVLRKIGGGAYGEVWLAKGVTGALRAVKIVHRADFSDDRTFEREFDGILNFEPISRDHPGLVHILHVGRSVSEDGPFYYYVMELGDDARRKTFNPVEYEPRTVRTDFLLSDGPMDTDLIIETGKRLALALGHLHDRNLTHRDVKPSNIIFVEGKAKLADIGLVAALDQRTFVGTEGFVPPEGPGSAAADVYSLGKVLYEMATGMDRLQFPELPDQSPPPEQRKKWIQLNRVICEACEPRLARRKYTTADDFAQALATLQQGKKARSKAPLPLPTKILLGVMAVIFLLMSQLAFRQSWGTIVIEGAREQLPLAYRRVILLSQPSDATVYDDQGLRLGATKLSFPLLEAGKEFRVLLEKEGYRDTWVDVLVDPDEERVQYVEVRMLRDAPPKSDELWQDAQGSVYRPEGERHLAIDYVSAENWRQFLNNTEVAADDLPHTFTTYNELGQSKEVVLTTRAAARKFTDWLTDLCRAEGYLREIDGEGDHEIIVDYGSDFPRKELPQEALARNLRPFRGEVRTIPYARFQVDTEPSKASLYIDGRYVGTTPWEDFLPPGVIRYTVQLEGYNAQTRNTELGDRDNFSDLIQLERRPEVVTFGKPWRNSLGLDFVPMGTDLMVARFETRVQDYRQFTEDTGHLHTGPTFEQKDDHPVVNVTRDDARAFCEWLTQREQAEDSQRIQDRHRYRLPTDAEWSRMVGLTEYGSTPEEREDAEGNEKIFPWGEHDWPPPTSTGNYNEDEIEGYSDLFPYTAPVGSYPADSRGLHDISGNVFEWVEDAYRADGSWAVARGASWLSHDPAHLASRFRSVVTDEEPAETHGFRLVLVKMDEAEALEIGAKTTEDEDESTEEDSPAVIELGENEIDR